MNLIARIYRFWVVGRARAELRELSDHTLRDIGLRRGDIDALFR